VVKYSVSSWIYGDEPLERSMERLSKFGYDGIEIYGEPQKVSAKEIWRLSKRYGLEASSICGIYTKDRDLVSSSEKTRNNAINYVKDCAKMAHELGVSAVIVVPSAVNKVKPEVAPDQEWKWAVEGVREAGRYAMNLGVSLAIEALNRYETYLVNRISQAMELVEDVALDNVGLMVDCFHMSIEDESLANAIIAAKKKLLHVHIADSNRQAPGRGHTDFQSVVSALKQIGYSRYLTMEFLPPSADPYAALKGARTREFYDLYTKESIEYMKRIWQ